VQTDTWLQQTTTANSQAVCSTSENHSLASTFHNTLTHVKSFMPAL